MTTVFTPEFVHVRIANPVMVYVQTLQSWMPVSEMELRPENVGNNGTDWVLLLPGGQILWVPVEEAVVHTTVRDTYPVDVVTANGVAFVAKTVLGGMDAARALEGLGDLSDLLMEAFEARSCEAALGFAIV